jgi:hypothetical protein
LKLKNGTKLKSKDSHTAIDELTNHLGRLINFFVDEVNLSLSESCRSQLAFGGASA